MLPQMLELMYFTESQALPSVSVESHKMSYHFHVASLARLNKNER